MIWRDMPFLGKAILLAQSSGFVCKNAFLTQNLACNAFLNKNSTLFNKSTTCNAFLNKSSILNVRSGSYAFVFGLMFRGII